MIWSYLHKQQSYFSVAQTPAALTHEYKLQLSFQHITRQLHLVFDSHMLRLLSGISFSTLNVVTLHFKTVIKLHIWLFRQETRSVIPSLSSRQ